jgi:hypothetical protein
LGSSSSASAESAKEDVFDQCGYHQHKQDEQDEANDAHSPAHTAHHVHHSLNLISLFLIVSLSWWPSSFYVVDYGPYLVIGHLVAKTYHVALVIRHNGGHAQLCYSEKLNVGVMPRVSRLIMRRSGHFPVGFSSLPIRLAFEILPMARCTMLGIERLTPVDLVGCHAKLKQGPAHEMASQEQSKADDTRQEAGRTEQFWSCLN